MLNTLLTALTVVVALTLVNAFYVATEFALVGARRTRMSELADEGSGTARVILRILEDHILLDRGIAAAQIGITLASLVAGYVGQALFAPILLPWLARIGLSSEVAAATVAAAVILLGITSFQVIFGELLPKSIALRFPERIALACARPLQWSMTALSPFIALFNGTAFAFMRLLGIPHGGPGVYVHTPQELEGLFQQSARGGVIDAGEREMLHNIFQLDERVV
ncbi:MAG TPA: CNNM domain-containing protein, partial [Deinococcales bacterium]|nr:CNNM domain-containing protein [Deinococcales bacterium]